MSRFLGGVFGEGQHPGAPTSGAGPGVWDYNNQYFLNEVNKWAIPTEVTGGTILPAPSRSGWTVHEFTASGSLVVPGAAQNPGGNPISSVELLVSAPGGGGGYCDTGDGGGGGGGGAVYYNTSYPLPATTYTVTLPEGGEGSSDQTAHGSKGGDAVFGSLTITGGGGGGSTKDSASLPPGGATGGCGSDGSPNTATS